MSTQVLEPETTAIPLEKVISTNMRVALAVRGKNQTDLSRALGVSRGLISQKMNGTTAWTIPDMEKAGQFLKIAPAKFLEPNGLLAADSGFGPWTGGPWTGRSRSRVQAPVTTKTKPARRRALCLTLAA